MKISKKKQHSRKIKTILLVVATLVILALAYIFVAHAKQMWPFEKVPTTTTAGQTVNPPTQQENSDAKAAAQSAGTTTDKVPINNALTAHIDSVTESGNSVVFAGSVTNTTAAGNCSVTFSNPNDHPVSVTVDATLSGTTATCNPMSISAAQFSYLGEWTVTFRYLVNNTQAVATGTVMIQ